MIKINGSFIGLLVSSHHVNTKIFNQLALFLKSYQLLLVLAPNIFAIGWVECYENNIRIK